LKHYKALHERVVMMRVETEDVPRVPAERRLEIKEVGKGFHTMLVRYGFMDEPNVMRAQSATPANDRFLTRPRMGAGSALGHEERFPPRRLNVRYRFS